jgi:REP element-mobilizing transposase RayT
MCRALGSREHGGDTRKGLRKTARPFNRDTVVHLVFKSDRAQGKWSFLHRRNRARIEALIYTQARKAGVRVYRHAVVGNHLHILAKATNKPLFTRFLRALPGLIARHVTGVERGKSGERTWSIQSSVAPGKTRTGTAPRPRFWQKTVYSRWIAWGREYRILKAYLGKNRLEAVGFGGAVLRILPDGQTAVVVGAPEYRPGYGDPPEP